MNSSERKTISAKYNLVVTTNITYPATGTGTATIDYINLQDAYAGTAAEFLVIVKGGGLGYKFVNLTLQSAKSKAIAYDISIYGQ
jgi:hypothetical protein